MENISLVMILQLAGGALLLLAGRKLFWFLVGLAGATAGLAGNHIIMHDPAWYYVLAAGILGGALAILLAHFLKAITFGVGGFIGGGYLAHLLLQWLGQNFGALNWVAYIIGGVIGAVLLVAAFEFALKLITSAVGAYYITRVLPTGSGSTTIIFTVLVLVGVWFQSRKKKPRATDLPAQPNP
jgi:hypothetical protein